MLHDPVYSTVSCIIDGLDECDESLQEVLLAKFSTLFSSLDRTPSECHFKLIVVSRALPKFIPGYFLGSFAYNLDINSHGEFNNDILRFIDDKVEELSRCGFTPYLEELRVQVKKIFRERAKGMFL